MLAFIYCNDKKSEAALVHFVPIILFFVVFIVLIASTYDRQKFLQYLNYAYCHVFFMFAVQMYKMHKTWGLENKVSPLVLSAAMGIAIFLFVVCAVRYVQYYRMSKPKVINSMAIVHDARDEFDDEY